MILEENLFEVGCILKAHGLKGEIIILFHKSEYSEIDIDYYFLLIDGIYVPFFIEDFWYSSDTSARVKFEDVNTMEQASLYSDTKIFLPQELLEYINVERVLKSKWEKFIGYIILKEDNTRVGKIKSVDTSTINELFIVDIDNEREVLIPATDDFITKTDSEQKVLTLNLPNGLLEL